MKPPTITIERLWHVGDLEAGSKRRNSYEGTGLSVSLHPGAWRTIGRGIVGGGTWALDRQGACFLHAVHLNVRQKKEILAWGMQQGYVAEADLWKWSYWDDDLDQEVYQTFLSRAEAVEEAECDEDDECVTKVAGHISTASLDTATMQDGPSHGTASVLDLLLPLYVEKATDLDGVWWDERLDPLCLSAPRGVIPADRLTKWTISSCEFDPDD